MSLRSVEDTAKRCVDIAIATIALVIFSPLIIGIVAMVRFKLGAPVLFRQSRPGRHGIPFEMMKFRTMTDERDENGALLPDKDRLPSFGRWLRASSLDELPELLNVLRGDMSLVGPRPLLMQYLPLYSPEQARRHIVRPGVTGWAQINGRNALDWEEKFKLDCWYVDNRSLALDFRILGLTLLKVLGREGISADGQATMTAFTGSETDGDKSVPASHKRPTLQRKAFRSWLRPTRPTARQARRD